MAISIPERTLVNSRGRPGVTCEITRADALNRHRHISPRAINPRPKAPELLEEMRLCISEESFLEIWGILQKVDGVIHINAREIMPLLMEQMATPGSHDFH